MTFTAKYPGRCHADCGETIEPGDDVEYVDDQLVHEGCVPAPVVERAPRPGLPRMLHRNRRERSLLMPKLKIHLLTEGQIAVRLDYRDLPDLDVLMLDIWQEHDDGFRYGDPTDDDDEPTRFASQREPEWQWVKVSPCHCGEHGWHWDSQSAERWPRAGLGMADLPVREGEPDLLSDRPKGRFVAMEWSR